MNTIIIIDSLRYYRFHFFTFAISAILFFALYLNTLTAYNIFSIPIPWLSYAFATIVCFIISMRQNLHISVPPLVYPVLLYFVIALLGSLGHLLSGFPPQMPSGASTPYFIFILARFFVLIGFIMALLGVYNFCLRFGTSLFIKILLIILILVLVTALYIYIAQLYGLWEPPRNRIGTAGQEFISEGVSFQYLFHRALGTFREPSHLVEWILGPSLIILTILIKKPSLTLLVVISLSILCIVLSGSLLGTIGILFGILTLLLFGFIKVSIKSIIFFCIILAMLQLGAWLFSVNFLDAILPRLESLIYGGIGESNRAYIWNYLFDSPPPFLGYGIGNANLILSEYRHISLVSSHLNLFVNSLYGLGIISLIILLPFIYKPFLIVSISRMARRDPICVGCIAAHTAWIVFYLGHSEEFSFIHAVILGLLCARMKEICNLSKQLSLYIPDNQIQKK